MNSVPNQVLLAVIGIMQASKPYATIRIGALPADNGISIYPSTGAPDTTFQNKGMSYELDCVLNGKHYDEEIVSDALNDLHRLLTQAETYPTGDDWQITNIITTATPSYIEREDNGQHLYGSALRIRFFYKKGAI